MVLTAESFASDDLLHNNVKTIRVEAALEHIPPWRWNLHCYPPYHLNCDPAGEASAGDFESEGGEEVTARLFTISFTCI